MKKFIAIASCLLAFSSVSHAGFLDLLTKANDVKGMADKGEQAAQAAQTAQDAQMLAENPAALAAVLVQRKIGEKADLDAVKKAFGEPVSVAKNAEGNDVITYDISVVFKALGDLASMVSSVVPATKSVEVTFKDGMVSSVVVVDPAAAPAPAAEATAPAAAPSA